MTGATPHVSHLQLDEWLAGELDAQMSEQVAHHLRECAVCKQRHDQRVALGNAFLEAAPSFTQHARLIEQQRRGPRRMKANEWIVSALVAAGALLALKAGIMRDPDPLRGQALEAARGKGSARIGYYFKRDGRVTRGDAHTQLQAGDLLRFVYSTERAAYLALFDRDQRGASVYFPADAERAVNVSAGSDMALEFSVELDGAPGDERIYALFCRDAIELAPVLERLRASTDPPAVPGCALDVLVLHKGSAPSEGSSL